MKEFTIISEFYTGENDGRTKIRLQQVQDLNMELVGTAQFGLPGLMSGLYIEKVWHLDDKEWVEYMAFVCSLKGGENKVTCPTCNKTGKWDCIAKVIDANGCHDAPAVRMTCPTCGGKGEVDPVEMARRQAENEAFWCQCENSSGSHYVSDGESDVCSKHHYICYDCGKVSQVG